MFQTWKWEFFLLSYKLHKLGKLSQLIEKLTGWWLAKGTDD